MKFECCWFNPDRNPLECPNVEDGEEYLFSSPRKRLVEKCIDCPWFKRDLATLAEDDPFRQIVQVLGDEYREQKAHLQSLSAFLSSKSREIKFLHELSMVLQTSMELDEILSVAMTAITSGKGFGMNRAFLLMVDRERKKLLGHLGVGPRDYEEAWRIWDEVDRNDFNLTELSKEFYKKKLSSEKAKFQDILERLTVSRDDTDHVFNTALRERRPILVDNAYEQPEIDRHLPEILGVSRFLIMPLISRNRSIGVLLADNFVTNKPISPRDVQMLQTFALPVAFAIERASLYERVQEEVEKQTRANLKLKEQQELIVKMEKMAVVGKITASVAHSIRNPVTAIGGFARSLLKNGDLESKKKYLQYILNEATLLDNVLEEVLNYAESLHPVMDRWEVNQLVLAAVAEMKPRLEELHVAIDLQLTPELPTAWLDYKQISYCLKTIMNHVALNQPAVDRIVVETFRDDERIKLCVNDDGIPLSAEMKNMLMTPFMETATLGQGIGLPLCRMILERHGSFFAIEDRPGGGTKYCIILQQHQEEETR